MKVVKRDGRRVNFNKDKIKEAILKAFIEVDGEETDYAKEKAKDIANYIEKLDKTLKVEEIQDIVEEKLMASNRKDIAKAYILYRNERNRFRELNSDVIQDAIRKIFSGEDEKQNANVDEKSFGGRIGEASNVLLKWIALNYCVDETTKRNHEENRSYLHDLNAYAVGEHNCLSMPIDKLMRDGFNTRQTDVRGAKSINTFMQLLAVLFQLQSLQQFGGVSATHIDHSAVPYIRYSFYKHYTKAMNLINKLLLPIFRVKLNIDENKVDIISIDDKIYTKGLLKKIIHSFAKKWTIKETDQAVEGMYHNLNTLQSRSGNQLPFSSINYGTCTLEEGRIVIKSILKGSLKGTGRLHKTSIFPCGIFQCHKDINLYKGTPNYDLFQLAIKSTVKRLYPNYANCNWSVQEEWIKQDRLEKWKIVEKLSDNEKDVLIKRIKENPNLELLLNLKVVKNDDNIESLDIDYRENPMEIFSTMGCRTANGRDINYDYNIYKANLKSVIDNRIMYNDTFISSAQKDGRGNIAPSTIILPTIAMESKEDAEKHNLDLIETFFKHLDKIMEETRESLMNRFNLIANQSFESARFMYENNTMEGYNESEGIKSALKHGTLAFGQLGLAETLQILVGCDHTEHKGMELAKRIESFFRDKCNEYKKKYKINAGVYYTPAEGLCFTAMSKFKKKYGVIPNVSENKFFTNSIHVPVWKEISPIEKINIESQLTGYSNAGCITYVELDSCVEHNLKGVEDLIIYAMEQDIPYFAINVPNDTCMDCGYCGDIPLDTDCPKCGSDDIRRLRRVTGYLTSDYKTAFNEGKQQEVEMRIKHDRYWNK